MTVVSLSMSEQYYREIIEAFPDVSERYWARNSKILVILALAKNARKSGLIEDLYVEDTVERDMIVEGCLNLDDVDERVSIVGIKSGGGEIAVEYEVKCEFWRKYARDDGDEAHRCLEGNCLRPFPKGVTANAWGNCCAICPDEYSKTCDLKCSYDGEKPRKKSPQSTADEWADLKAKARDNMKSPTCPMH